MATLAVVLALAAGGGQALADAASSAATGVKRALKLSKKANKKAKAARTLAHSADARALAADAKAQQALTQKSPDADRLDGLDAAAFVRAADAGAFARGAGAHWRIPSGSDEELVLPGLATLYVDCADNGYETEIRVYNTSGSEQKAVLVSDQQDVNPPDVLSYTLAPAGAANRILGTGADDGAASVEATVMPADGSGPSTRFSVVVLTRAPATNCVADVRALTTP